MYMNFIEKTIAYDDFNVINTKYNHICWNDGYHTVHHLRPGLHYLEIPGEFLKLKDQFAEKKTFVFDGIHYLHVFIWLMTKRYDKLASHLVNINGNTFSSEEEAIALMKERSRKIIITEPHEAEIIEMVPSRRVAESTL